MCVVWTLGTLVRLLMRTKCPDADRKMRFRMNSVWGELVGAGLKYLGRNESVADQYQ